MANNTTVIVMNEETAKMHLMADLFFGTPSPIHEDKNSTENKENFLPDE